MEDSIGPACHLLQVISLFFSYVSSLIQSSLASQNTRHLKSMSIETPRSTPSNFIHSSAVSHSIMFISYFVVQSVVWRLSHAFEKKGIDGI